MTCIPTLVSENEAMNSVDVVFVDFQTVLVTIVITKADVLKVIAFLAEYGQHHNH